MRDIEGQGDAGAPSLGKIEREKRKDNPAGRGVPDERSTGSSGVGRSAAEGGQAGRRAPQADVLPDAEPGRGGPPPR
jgi:hypothetical protein